MITVYRFRYLDRRTGGVVESDDFATEKAIAEIGATRLEHTAKDVEERGVSQSGILTRTPG